MTILLAVAILALIAFLVYRDLLWEQRLSKLELERGRERAAAAAERKELYQRIQAPEIAIHDAQLEARRERPYTPRKPIGADDDAAYAARRQAERAQEVDGG